MAERESARPAVSVIVPFVGDSVEAEEMLSTVSRLRLRDDDELIVADNTLDCVLGELSERARVKVVHAPNERSSYHARNIGAESATTDWLLLLDADCRPRPDLLDVYFSHPVDDRCGAVAGEVLGDPAQTSLSARYSRSRRYLNQEDGANFAYRPAAVTANLLIRREAWAAVGGFLEGVRSGSDSDFSWRLQEAGWTLAYRPDATVEHRHRETLLALTRQIVRYGASRAWLVRRHPGSFEPLQPGRRAARALAAAVRWTLGRDFERARFRALDSLALAAEASGFLLDNRAITNDVARRVERADVVVITDRFPVLSETFVANEIRALKRAGVGVHVEAAARAERPDRATAREIRAAFQEDDSIAGRLRDLIWLITRHPLRSAADVRARRAWTAEEHVPPLRVIASVVRRVRRSRARHVHAHFAVGAALHAMRLSRLLAIPYSVAAHAFDIYREPRNLRTKLAGAAFAVGDCRYTVDDLADIVGPEHASRMHVMTLGVDGERFRRHTPYPGGRTVVALGRLVEKKGFEHLIAATALLARRNHPPDRVVIAGGGHLAEHLRAEAGRLGLTDTIEFTGPRDPQTVRELLEQADVFAVPCVVAANGDRDGQPVVVREALAMEIPVVASREVGLPEVVQDGWGRLVPPGDPEALAAALEELLALPPERRRQMGAAGRAWAVEHSDLDREAAKLMRLIAEAVG